MNPMSISDYIKTGLSEEEARERVQRNRDSLRASLNRKNSRKTFNKFFPNNNLNEDFMLETYLKFRELKVIEWALYIKEICDYFGYDIEYSSSYLYDKLCHYISLYPRPLLRVDVIKDIFGEGSPRHLFWIEKNKKCATCSFDKFKEQHNNENLSDDELYKLFCETYGSNNLNRLKTVYNVDDDGAREIIKDRWEKAKKTWDAKDEEDRRRIYKSKGRSEENYILKYGEELGKIKYQELLDSLQGMGTLSWYIEKFGEEEGQVMYNEKRGRHNAYYCAEYWLFRGYTEEETVSILKDAFSKRGNFSKEYCIEKYGFVKGIEVWKARQVTWQTTLNNKPKEEIEDINKRKGLTLENYILKYGEEIGTIKYNERKTSVIRTTNVSKSSLLFFIPLYKTLRRLKLVEKNDVKWGIANNTEFFIRDKEECVIRFYDFVIPKYKIIVEYNGKIFHPKEGDYNWKSPFGKSYDEVFAYDRQKEHIAKKLGYKVFYVWEEDINKNYNDILTDMVITNIINGGINEKN